MKINASTWLCLGWLFWSTTWIMTGQALKWSNWSYLIQQNKKADPWPQRITLAGREERENNFKYVHFRPFSVWLAVCLCGAKTRSWLDTFLTWRSVWCQCGKKTRSKCNISELLLGLEYLASEPIPSRSTRGPHRHRYQHSYTTHPYPQHISLRLL